ncbi:hypothetical protein [Beijerinckia sp. L45]|uniref:helix-turn-helix domain-containing protein n=1 Tax=Beijerinckia sp. L45 TaxID=1641855 RepID=UPI00131B63A7|nr:hypothetical protein [Beijerinckia sp. L45]
MIKYATKLVDAFTRAPTVQNQLSSNQRKLNHSMLALARNLRRLSQQELMTPLGIDRSEYSRLERGQVIRSSIKTDALAMQLNLPCSFFLQKYYITESPSTIQVRGCSMERLRNKAKEETYLDANLRLFHLKQLDLVRREGDPQIIESLIDFSHNPAKTADYIKEKLFRTDGPTLGLVKYIESIGVFVVGCNFEGPIDGVTLRANDFPACIFLNQKAPIGDMRLALAREFFHLLTILAGGDKSYENAQVFAERVLYSKGSLCGEMKKMPVNDVNISLLSKRWMVPTETIMQYLIEEGLITAAFAKKILSSRSLPNGKTQESVASISERPVTMASLILAAGIDAMDVLHCSKADLERLYNLSEEDDTSWRPGACA